MRAISLEQLNEFFQKDYNHNCAICGDGQFQIHHSVIFGGAQVSDVWSLVPLCKSCHDEATPHNPAYKKEVEEKALLFALNHATDDELKKYSKVENLLNKKIYLNEKYFSGKQISQSN